MSDSAKSSKDLFKCGIWYFAIIFVSSAISIVLLAFPSVLPNTWDITHKLVIEVTIETYQRMGLAINVIVPLFASVGMLMLIKKQSNKN